MSSSGGIWPQCEHLINDGKQRCPEDSLGHCDMCKVDACWEHLDGYHKHVKRKDPPYVKDELRLQELAEGN